MMSVSIYAPITCYSLVPTCNISIQHEVMMFNNSTVNICKNYILTVSLLLELLTFGTSKCSYLFVSVCCSLALNFIFIGQSSDFIWIFEICKGHCGAIWKLQAQKSICLSLLNTCTKFHVCRTNQQFYEFLNISKWRYGAICDIHALKSVHLDQLYKCIKYNICRTIQWF